jgi:hypothetical protein
MGVVMALLALQVDVAWGGLRTNAILAWLGAAGLVLYGFLVLTNVLLLVWLAWKSLRRRIGSSPT